MVPKNSETAMPLSAKKSQSEFAKIMPAACVRRGFLEKLHCGTTPVSGDYSDGEISWNEVSRINQDEMKTLMIGVVNRIHTFLARTLLSPSEDKVFAQALDRAAAPWVKC